ncbi:ribonuclease Z [Spongiibacter tropicus]|uniref:ribonuclease Z n=1 Tax=Spongiibacter tropicus TaxID=454602 RepID=UPI0003B405E3|nr:ribonuclease Z [Spongiibacter tropicus]
MRVTFLGTSAGTPTRQRNVTGLAMAIDDARDWYLFDCGEATQHQLQRTRYTTARLRAVFITHVHGDHCYGLPGLIASANMSGRKTPLTICAPDGIEQFIRATFLHTDIRELRFPLHFVRSDLPDFSYDDGQLHVSAHPLSHRVPCFAYRAEEQPPRHLLEAELDEAGLPRGPQWNRLQRGEDVVSESGELFRSHDFSRPAWPPRSIIVGGDNDQPELLHDAMCRSDVMIHEATFSEEVLAKVGPKYMHSTAAMVAKAASEAGLRQLILTHFSQRYRLKGGDHVEHSIDDLIREARSYYEGNLYMAEDLHSYQLDRDRQLYRLDEPGH